MAKNDTKHRILDEALEQLNKNGLPAVSIRSISNQLNLSSGNLTYHFKNIDVIIYELYLMLVKEMGEHLKSVEQTEINLDSIAKDTEISFKLLWKYRFLLLDFIAINRRIPKMNVHFKNLIQLRKIQFKVVIDRLVQTGILIPAPTPSTYNTLIDQMLVFSNAWIPDAELLFNDQEEEIIITHYLALFKAHLTPYLK